MALQRIILRDFVLVESLELELQAGFNVLTGETGAGKSILLEALQLVMGARAESQVVREGTAKADISAAFDPTDATCALLEEMGIAADADDELLLRRTIDVQGKSRGWINGTPATATQLRALGALLVDMLVKVIRREPVEQKQIIRLPALIVRESSGAPQRV